MIVVSVLVIAHHARAYAPGVGRSGFGVVRFNKDTGYRGGGATNMKEEFAEYGLSESTMYAVGATKVGLAGLMLLGHREPRLVRPASSALAALMAGAIGMHMRVGDPVERALPAISVFTLSSASALLDRRE